MAKQSPPLEPELKAALAQRLISRGDLQGDAVLINEFNVANWSRRADLVVANGKLHAYEIKSEADSLDRLHGQVTTYLQHFDKVTVVAARRHTDKVLRVVPDSVEVVAVGRKRDTQVGFKVLQRGRTQKVSDKHALINLLHAAEIASILREGSFCLKGIEARADLEALAEGISVKNLRAAVLKNLKSRYAEAFGLFSKVVAPRSVCAPDLELLSNMRLKRSKAQKLLHVAVSERPTKRLDLSSIGARWGDVPVDMPEFVRPRIKS